MQLVYPKTINDGKIHFIMFNINQIEHTPIYNEKPTSRVVENPTDGPSNVKFSSSGPVIYESNSSNYANIMSSGDMVLARYKRIDKTIVLQVPDDISVNYGIEWRQSNLGTAGRLGNLAASGAEAALDEGTGVGEFGENAASILVNGVPEMLAAGSQKYLGVNIQDLLERAAGRIVNPLVEVLFKSVYNRSFILRFVFFARNAEESKTIHKIINAFKYHSHPELLKGPKPYYKYPDTFDITYMLDTGSRNPWLHRMSTCALTNIQVQETPNGRYTTHKDGSPIVRDVTLTFMEMEQMHKSRFEDDFGAF